MEPVPWMLPESATAGVPVGTLAIDKAGAINAALLAAQILGVADGDVRAAVQRYRAERTDKVLQASKSLSRPS